MPLSALEMLGRDGVPAEAAEAIFASIRSDPEAATNEAQMILGINGGPNGQLVSNLCKVIEQQSVRIRELVDRAEAAKRVRLDKNNPLLDPANDAEVARVLLLAAAARMGAPSLINAANRGETGEEEAAEEEAAVRRPPSPWPSARCTARRHHATVPSDSPPLAMLPVSQAPAQAEATTVGQRVEPSGSRESLVGLDVSPRPVEGMLGLPGATNTVRPTDSD